MNTFSTLALLGVLASAVAHAQPTLTQATNAPAAGGTLELHYSPIAAPGSAGANALWDFSALAVDSTDVVQWVLPSATVNGALFPTADVAELWDVIAYSEVDPTGLFVVGSDEQGTIVTYSDPRQALPFPCTYQTTWNDPYEGAYTMQGLDVVRSGNYGGTADGYGELIMPWGSVPDVLRIHVQAAQEDSTAFGTLYLYIDAYQYFVVGSAWPVAEVVTSTAVSIGGTFTVAYTLWMDELSTGVRARPPAPYGLAIGPVPASEWVTVHSRDGWGEGAVIRIRDAQGRLVRERNVPFSGPATLSFDITTLAPGTYSAIATDRSGQETRALFVVAH